MPHQRDPNLIPCRNTQACERVLLSQIQREQEAEREVVVVVADCKTRQAVEARLDEAGLSARVLTPAQLWDALEREEQLVFAMDGMRVADTVIQWRWTRMEWEDIADMWKGQRGMKDINVVGIDTRVNVKQFYRTLHERQ